MNSFVISENNKRTTTYHKNERIEQMFRAINHALAPLEVYEPSGEDRPTLFIFGLPRSGTTLTYQLVAQCLEVGYINNLSARFWQAPLQGITLAQSALGDYSAAAFDSNLGKTSGPYGPHEFAYFWQEWLKVEGIADMLCFNQPNASIDWAGLGRVVRCMQDAFGKGIVFKTMYAANHIKAFADTFSMPLFIYIERDSVDVGLSILSARKAYYGNPDEWWATYSPDYLSLAGLPFEQQIAGQVHSLRKTYEETLALLNPDRVIRIDYPRLCQSPGKLLEEICTRLQTRYGYDQKIRVAPPSTFEVQRKSGELDQQQQAVVNAINRMK